MTPSPAPGSRRGPPLRDELVTTLRRVWQAGEKWIVHHALNKHLLLGNLLRLAGSDAAAVYRRASRERRPHLSRYATLRRGPLLLPPPGDSLESVVSDS